MANALNKATRDEIEILIFEFMGTCIGIDMVQILEVCEQEVAENKTEKIFWFHEKFSSVTGEISYSSPKTLIIQDGATRAGLVIDMPRAVVSLPIDSVLALPNVVESCKEGSPFWGVVIQQDGLVLLLDVIRLMNGT